MVCRHDCGRRLGRIDQGRGERMYDGNEKKNEKKEKYQFFSKQSHMYGAIMVLKQDRR